MTDYRSDYRAFQREAFWTIPRAATLVAAIAAAGFIVSIVLTPLGVVSKVTQPDRVLSNYEFFFDSHNAYKARVAQVGAHVRLLASERDDAERRRIRIELSAMTQSCRDTAARYNSASSKLNTALFKSSNLPHNLPMETCDVPSQP